MFEAEKLQLSLDLQQMPERSRRAFQATLLQVFRGYEAKIRALQTSEDYNYRRGVEDGLSRAHSAPGHGDTGG